MSLATADIQFESVSFRYGRNQPAILNDLVWRVDAGEFLVVAGHTGSGKSTLLRAINGLVPHFSGGQFQGKVISGDADTMRTPTRQMAARVGMVFQDPDAASVGTTVEDEIAFGMEQAGIERSVMRMRIEELLDLLGIEALRMRNVTTLSGGERQRVSLAAALAMRPKILILDEPTSQLDPQAAEDIARALRGVNEDFGTTIVLAEHRLERVAPLADRLRYHDRSGEVTEGAPVTVLEGISGLDIAPMMRIGRHLGWTPLPLDVKSARRFSRKTSSWTASFADDLERRFGATAINLEGVSAKFERDEVLHQISLETRFGEVVAFIGRNGSGKTTLLRTVMGLHPFSDGVIIDPSGNVALPGKRKRIRRAGYLPQRPRSLLFQESVLTELSSAFIGRETATELDRLIEEFDLEQLLEQHPFDLSVGEQERVALAVAFATSAQSHLLLLDEPTRGMDYRHKRRLAVSIRTRQNKGVAVLLATHDIELVADVADRVVLLAHGSIIREGSPRDVLPESFGFAPQLNRVFGGGVISEGDFEFELE